MSTFERIISIGHVPPEPHLLILDSYAEEVYINHNDMGGRIPKLDRSKAKGKNKAEYENICSLKQLKVLQADCLSVKGYPAEIQCDCCTVCCNDNTDPQCIPVTRTKSTSTKKK